MANQTYISLETKIRQLINTDQAWHYRIIPKQTDNSALHFYTSEKADLILHELEMVFGKTIKLHNESEEVINNTLNRYYQRSNNREQTTISAESDDFIHQIVSEARLLNCSDIHIESFEEKGRVRFRLDGKLVERYIIDKSEYPAIVNKIKIKASLDIAEKRLPQDGRILYIRGNDKIDMRISVMPNLFGEKIVIRLLSKDNTNITLDQLGFSSAQLQQFREAIVQPHGIVLISGPTGSGKTTTLYGTLKELNKETVNILTIEDPIEYTLEGINQMQLNEAIGLTFAKALRTFLRQDPDIIMLGEIRDAETAQMAIRAALTGHLVLSTIHTNSAWGIVSRLIDMGIPRFMLSNTLNAAVSQRLVRTLCPACKKSEIFNADQYPALREMLADVENHYIPAGCDKCYYTGYKGRKALYEVIPVDGEIAGEIKNSTQNFRNIADRKQIAGLTDTAFELFAKGETSLDEVYPILISKQSD